MQYKNYSSHYNTNVVTTAGAAVSECGHLPRRHELVFYIDSTYMQEMIKTCSDYTTQHNLSFSTHNNPKKSKTKCMSFLKKKRILRNMKLNDKKLPWVNSVMHLGTSITDALNDMGQDLLEKRAQYVAKNNELMQEFHYAHPSTKTMLNNVHTSMYTLLWRAVVGSIFR